MAGEGVMKTVAVYGALLTAAVIYGGWALVAKMALNRGADPFVFAFYRCLGGSLVLFVAMSFAPNLVSNDKDVSVMDKVKSIPIHDVQRFAMLGAFMAANILGFILGASHLSALTCSIFQPTIPVFSMIFAVFFGVEQLSKSKIGGIAFMIVGAMCVAAFGEGVEVGGADDGASLVIGFLCILMNVSSTALYLVHNKDVLRTYEPVFATGMTYMFGAFIIFVMALVNAGTDMDKWLLGSSTRAWLGCMYAVCLTTALNYSLLSWANQQSTPIITASATTIQPLAAATLSLIFLNVGFSLGQMLGGGAIIAGLLVMVVGQIHESQEQEKALLLEKGLA